MNTTSKKYYSFGVLEGNHVEERFGLDHVNQFKDTRMTAVSEAKAQYSMNNSMYGVLQKRQEAANKEQNFSPATTLTQTYHTTPEKQAMTQTTPALSADSDKQKSLAFTHDGERAHILFGHGLNHEDLKKREMLSTYNLTYGSKIKPTDFIFSKFDSTAVPVIEPEDKVYIKNHLKNVTAIGDDKNLNHQKNYRPYNEFTRSFDSVQSKIAFRK